LIAKIGEQKKIGSLWSNSERFSGVNKKAYPTALSGAHLAVSGLLEFSDHLCHRALVQKLPASRIEVHH
jgi:hypothetical protein